MVGAVPSAEKMRSHMAGWKRTTPFILAALVAICACGTETAVRKAVATPSVSPVALAPPSPSPSPPAAPQARAIRPAALPRPPAGLPGIGLPLSGPLAYPLLIQIEDTFPARPSAGLGAASVIFEYLTEGNVLRFSALFHRVPGVVGPVRSARFVSIYLYQRLGALMMASGGSHWTYDRITAARIPAIINDFDHGRHFFRWNGRVAPHNLYTSQAQMINAASVGGRPARADDFLRSSTWPGTVPAASVSVPSLRSSFAWDGQSYAVTTDGAPQNDVIGGTVHAQAVAVLHVRQWVTNMQEDYTGGMARDFDLASGGAAELYANGTMVRGRWVASGSTGAIMLLDGTGQPVGMPPGLLWVALAL